MRIFFSVLTAVILGVAVSAQSRTGRLIGVVSGSHDERLDGVHIRIWTKDAARLVFETNTNKAGRFDFVGLPPGLYEMELSISGWESRLLSRVEVRAASTADLNVVLSPIAPSSLRQRSVPILLDRGGWWGDQFGLVALTKLPTTRRVWSLLENQAASTVTDKLDIGGLETGRPALFGAVGASWTENQYTLDGFNVTDPYLPGHPLTDPDFDSLSEVTIVAAAKPASFRGSGVNLLLSTSAPSSSFHGRTRLFFSNHDLQSDNMDARLIGLGFPGPERLNHLVDGSVQLGGKLPLTRVSWPFFVSLSTELLSKDLGGFAAPINAHVYHVLTKVSPVSRDTKQLDLLYAGQHIFNSQEGADPRIEPSATARGNDNFHQFQAHWRSLLTASTVLDTGFGVSQAIISSGIQPGTAGASTIDLPQMIRSGPAPLSFSGVRTRYEGNFLVQSVRTGPLGSHSLNFGGNIDRSNITNRWDSVGEIEQILVEGLGAEVTRWNTPTAARQHLQNVALFAQDDWRPAKWLALPFGLRFEEASGQAVSANNHIHWTTIEPRFGLAIPVRPRGLILRGSWSRFGHQLQGRYLDFGNQTALGGQIFGWQDSNADRQVQPQEITQLLRVFGGPYSALDRELKRPFTDEISLGLEWQLGRGFQASARFFRRDTHRPIEIVNPGVPFSSYIPTIVTDPGTDGIFGNADDQRLLLYNRQPSALGKDFLVLANPPGYRASFKGFEIEIRRAFAHRWEASGSFAATHASAPTNPGNSVFENDAGVIDNSEIMSALGVDPNTLLFAAGRTYFDRGFMGKLSGYYEAPYGIRLGAVAKYYDGLPFGRLLFVNGFNQGPFFVRVTPRADFGAFRTQFNSTLDVRVAREFSVRQTSISLDLDIFNLLNLNKNTLESDLTSPTFAQRVPLAIQAPRIIRLGLEWNF